MCTRVLEDNKPLYWEVIDKSKLWLHPIFFIKLNIPQLIKWPYKSSPPLSSVDYGALLEWFTNLEQDAAHAKTSR